MLIDPKTSRISVIIPTLDESARLATTLGAIVAAVQPGVEVLVVDGGSRDDTVAVAEAHGVPVLASPPGRGGQMNRGAAAARGEILLFLHGDTLLPPGFAAAVRQALAEPEVVAGAFRLAFAPPLPAVAWGANFRSRRLQLPFGDQALFLRRELFLDVGGFPEIPLLEDVALVRALRRRGRIAILPQAVVTSARRWQRRGVVANTLLNQLILFCFFLGVSPARLAGWYRRRGEKD